MNISNRQRPTKVHDFQHKKTRRAASQQLSHSTKSSLLISELSLPHIKSYKDDKNVMKNHFDLRGRRWEGPKLKRPVKENAEVEKHP